MKTKTLLIAAVMFFALSTVAFAQVASAVYSVSSTPITTVIATGNAEPAGDITFTQTGGTTVGPLSVPTSPLGTITIQYGGNNVNITSVFSQSMITNCTGVYLGKCPTVLLDASQYQPGKLVISIPEQITVDSTHPGAFTVTGVRVQIDGTTLSNLDANISSTGNQIAAGSTTVKVINSIAQGLAAGTAFSYTLAPGTVPPPLVTPNNTVPLADTSSKYVSNALINANNGNVAGSTVVIKVDEGFLGAWSKGVGVRIQLSATPPKGVTFAFPKDARSYDNNSDTLPAINSWTRGSSTSRTAATGGTTLSYRSSTTSSLQVYYYVATDIGSTVVETLEIPVTIAVDNTTATFPLPGITFTYTFTLAPVQGPYGDDGTPTDLLAPRFAARSDTAVGPATLAQIVSNSTTLLIPYAYASTGIAGDFQTAMAIANASEDPGTTGLLGLTGAIPQTGPVSFYLFPGASTVAAFNTLPMFTYTTKAGSPGSGLDANGNLPAGGTYSVFLNQIFPLATPPSGSTATLGTLFQGYVLVVTPFSNTHGIFLISDFTKITYQSSLMIVLANRNTSPESTVF